VGEKIPGFRVTRNSAPTKKGFWSPGPPDHPKMATKPSFKHKTVKEALVPPKLVGEFERRATGRWITKRKMALDPLQTGPTPPGGTRERTSSVPTTTEPATKNGRHPPEITKLGGKRQYAVGQENRRGGGGGWWGKKIKGKKTRGE